MGEITTVPQVFWGALMVLSGAAFLIRKRAVYVFIALAFAASWTNAALLQRKDVSPSDLAHIRGTVSEINDVSDFRYVVTLKDVEIDGETAHTGIRLYVYEETPTALGDRISLNAKTWTAKGATCPGGFDFRKYLIRKGIWLCATAKSDVALEGREESGTLFFDSLRQKIAASIDASFGDSATLAKAILLSDKNDMPDEQRESFQKAGVAHLLAVSGLHISCLAFAIGWVLRRMGLKRFAAFFATAPLIAVYVVVIGAPASAVRALVMYCMAELARVFGRKYDSLTAMGLAFLILAAPNPLSVTDTGLILSFTAVLGIVIFNPLLSEFLRVKRMKGVVKLAASALCVSLSAQIGTLPAVATLFGTLNTYAILTNIALVPLCTFALPIIAASVVIASLFPAASQAAVALPKLILEGMDFLAREVARLPGSTVYVPAWNVWAIIAFIAVCVLMSPYSRVPTRLKRALLLSPAVLMIICVIVTRLSLPRGLSITFADAGKADSSIVRAEGRTYFIDLGNEGCPSVDYLCYTGQGVDGVFLTHPHSDHCGGLKDLMSVRNIPAIYISGAWGENDYDELLRICEERGTRVEKLSAGDEIKLSENVVCDVLGPDPSVEYKKTNDTSLVMTISYGEGSALMTGDVSSKYEPDGVSPCQVLKAAHHGSKDGTSKNLLAAVKPSAVVITSSGSLDNISAKVLDRIAQAGATIYHTGRDGMITAIIGRDGTLDMESFL